MKKLFTILAALAIIVGVGARAEAATSDDIVVTVTIRNVSVLITAGDPWALGTMLVNTTSAANSCTAQNNGNVNEDFNIAVSNSTPATWTPGATAGAGVFVMDLDGTPLTPSAALATSVAPDGTDDFDLTFTTPTSSTDYTEQTITVTVTATATAT